MKCAEARHVILTADPATLRSRADASLCEHLDGCARCAADASHVVNDVARLRSALIARGSRAVAVPRSRNRTVATLIPIALAAELALFAFLSNRETVNPLLDQRVIDDSVTTLLPVAHPGIDTSEVVAPPTTTRASHSIATIAMTDDTTNDADSLTTPSASDLSSSSSPTSQLQVIPTNHRQRVAIIGTSNPKVTVVWLSKVDSL